MRVKSNWFQSGRSKTPQEIAGAAASIVWRIALNALNNMRRADFDIAVGPQYFEFLSEFLIFLVQVGDRIAYRHFSAEDRVAFTAALANRVGEILGDNREEYLDGTLPVHKANFIARLNVRADEYARYEYEKGSENFSFIRGLGLFMQDVMDERDRQWVVDQIMAVEAPGAIETLEKAMSGLLELEPRRPRGAGHGGGE
ncbi:MAG TPA: hypothetical protein VKC56_08705 [Gallionellaceae bacterium]|nr:hypothetical protein [Gallionellaceae bacterium]